MHQPFFSLSEHLRIFFHACNYDKTYVSICDNTITSVEQNYLFPGQPFQKVNFIKVGNIKVHAHLVSKGSDVKKRSIITLLFIVLNLIVGILLFLYCVENIALELFLLLFVVVVLLK